MITKIDKIIALAKGRGFVYPGSDIYGGLANTWDYGPLGIELKNNIRNIWWKNFVQKRLDIVGVDSAILMNPRVWQASGHVDGFSDPLIDCKACKKRHRADKLIEAYWHEKGQDGVADGWDSEKTTNYLIDNKIPCPDCKASTWGEVKKFNLMFKTKQGVTEDSSADIYLRPETAQGMFVNFKHIQRTTRKKVPFGIAQVGKAFRNEITPGNFIFRTREFEQMEIEYFVKPGTDKSWHTKWEEDIKHFLYQVLKVNQPDNFRLRWHNKDELSHYSSGTFDIEYNFPFGWSELWGCANRADFDLSQHQKFAGENMEYLDPETNEGYLPYVIEPTFGLTRTLLMILCDAYTEETLEDGTTRTVLKLASTLAPIKVAILPLMKKQSELAMAIYNDLAQDLAVDFDDGGTIGKRYRRQDEIGTPFCITVDFDTIGDGDDVKPELKNTVTVRTRDSMEQIRMPINELKTYLLKNLN